jgi:putative membrane protein
MNAQELGNALAPVNAALNTLSAVLLFSGYVAIKQRRIEAHRQRMQGAFVASLVFLVFYVARYYLTGSHRFPDVGFVRTIYLVILTSHMILAMVSLPLVIVTILRGRRNDIERHRKLARITFPIWAYVSVTGIVVYVMLYHVAPLLTPAQAAP